MFIFFSRAECAVCAATLMTRLAMTLQQGMGCRRPMLWILGIPGNSLQPAQMSHRRLSPVIWNHTGSPGQRKNAASSRAKSLTFVAPRFVAGSKRWGSTARFCYCGIREASEVKRWLTAASFRSSTATGALYFRQLSQSSLSMCGTVPVAEPALAAHAHDIPDLSFATAAVQAALIGPAWRALWVLPLHCLWLRDCQRCGFWKASLSSDPSSDRKVPYRLEGVVEETAALPNIQPTEGVFLGTPGAARFSQASAAPPGGDGTRRQADTFQSTGHRERASRLVSSLSFSNSNHRSLLTHSGKVMRNC